jgi:histidinol-phosphate aminotransferase
MSIRTTTQEATTYVTNAETPTSRIAERILALKPYIPGKPIEEVKREFGIIEEIVKLASNENPLGPSPKALEALQEALPKLALYPDGGCHDLREAVSKKRDVPGDWLIFGNGSDEIIHLIGLSLLTHGDEVVIGDPTFVLYEAAATLNGAKAVPVPLTRPDFRHDVKRMAEAFTPKTRLVFIANPHNPTGSTIGKREVEYLLERLPSRAILVLDEAYGEYVYDDPEFPAAIDYIRQGASVIGLRTYSKMYGLAGLRVGYGVAQPEIIAVLNQARSPFNVNLAAQAAAVAATYDDTFVERGKQVNAEGLQQLISAFDRLGLTYIPSQANFIMVDTKRPCREVFHALLRRAVIVRTGDIFGLPTMIRVTVGTREQNNKFITALETVLANLQEG